MTRTCSIAVVFLAATGCIGLGAQSDLKHYKETHGSRVSIVEYAVMRTAKEVIARSSNAGASDEIRWEPGVGTISWQQTDPILDNKLEATRTGDVILIKGRLRGKESKREIRVDGAPWYQIFGPIMSDLLPLAVAQREFWVINPEDFTAHKMQVRRVGAESLSFRDTLVQTDRIHFSPAGVLAAFWGADFWYRQRDGAWLYSRLPESGGVTVNELEDPGT